MRTRKYKTSHIYETRLWISKPAAREIWDPKTKFLRAPAVTPGIHGKYMNELSHMFTKYLPVQIPLLSV